MIFTNEQKEFLKEIYNIDISGAENTYKVRDGYVTVGDTVWWRASTGPVQVIFTEENSPHFENIKANPDLYQIATPQYVTSINYI